jgi:hypothetical protein
LAKFDRKPHPRIAEHKKAAGPPKTADEHVGFNGRVAILVTGVVGTMWCALRPQWPEHLVTRV